MSNINMVVGRITQLTKNVPLNKAKCRKCKEVFYIVELVGGICEDCRWEIKRKDRYNELHQSNKTSE